MSILLLIRRFPLVFYVVLNYLISWTFLYPAYQAILAAEEGSFPWIALVGIIGGFGPTIAAMIMVKFTEPKGALRELLQKYSLVKFNFKWYAFIFVIPILLYLFAIIFSSLFGFSIGPIQLVDGLKNILPYFLLALPFGPIMEELGWRGYMLPRLLKKFNIYQSSLILGLVWTFWHIASFSFPGAAIPSAFEVNAFSIGLYLLSITAQTFIFSYVYLYTKGSVFIAILLHMTFNASSNIGEAFFSTVEFPADQQMCIYILHIVLIAALGLYLFLRQRNNEVLSR